MDLSHASGSRPKHVEVFERIAYVPDQNVPRRGVGWVLRWAAAIAVLWFSGCVLARFAFLFVAEHTLGRAARAGALEATLPRATYRTVAETVTRRIADHPAWDEQFTLSVKRNDAHVGGAIRAVGGDRMTVTLSLPAHAVLPKWMGAFSVRSSDARIEISAERNVAGRELHGIPSL